MLTGRIEKGSSKEIDEDERAKNARLGFDHHGTRSYISGDSFERQLWAGSGLSFRIHHCASVHWGRGAPVPRL